VNIVYRITYNVYRLNTVASRNVFQGFQGGTPRPFGTPLSRGEFFPLIILFAKQDSISFKSIVLCFLISI